MKKSNASKVQPRKLPATAWRAAGVQLSAIALPPLRAVLCRLARAY
jgi:hypothetical protein